MTKPDHQGQLYLVAKYQVRISTEVYLTNVMDAVCLQTQVILVALSSTGLYPGR